MHNLDLWCLDKPASTDTLKDRLPEVGDLQRSSDVAEHSLMSHKPTAEQIKHKLESLFWKCKQ